MTRFGVIQLGVQGLGAVSGILLVRSLNRGDFAIFTIANSMQGVVNVLADSGVSVALISIGGRVWQDKRRLGQLIDIALKVRYKLAFIAALVVIPILSWLLLRNGAKLPYATFIVLAVLSGLSFQLGLDVFIVVPRLHSQIRRLQWLDFCAAALRLVLLSLCFAIFLNALIAIWIATLCFASQYVLVRRWASERSSRDSTININDQREVASRLRHLLPGAVFYCLQSQIVVFLVSVSGRSGEVADVGALGRVTVLLSIFGPMMNAIVLPAFSRCHTKEQLRKRYFLVLGAYVVLGTAITLFALVFSRQLLWILGNSYSGLDSLLVLMTVNLALSLVSGVMWSLNAAKAWVEDVWVEIPLRLLIQGGLVFVCDLTTIRGALWFSICSFVSPIIMNSFLTVRGLRATPRCLL